QPEWTTDDICCVVCKSFVNTREAASGAAFHLVPRGLFHVFSRLPRALPSFVTCTLGGGLPRRRRQSRSGRLFVDRVVTARHLKQNASWPLYPKSSVTP